MTAPAPAITRDTLTDTFTIGVEWNDAAPEQIDALLSHIAEGATRRHASFHRGDVRTVPAENGSVDLVASIETLEHLEDDGPLLEEFGAS